MKKGNIFSTIPDSAPEELFETLLSTDQFKLERIISSGQQTEPGKWYDQTRDEWVILLKGSAGLLFEGTSCPLPGGTGGTPVGTREGWGEGEVVILHPGDYIHIPAHRRHRVEWTSKEEVTLWLAFHFPSSSPKSGTDLKSVPKRGRGMGEGGK